MRCAYVQHSLSRAKIDLLKYSRGHWAAEARLYILWIIKQYVHLYKFYIHIAYVYNQMSQVLSVMCFFWEGVAAMDKLWLLLLLIIVLPERSTDSYYVMQPKEKVENHALIIWDFCLWVLSKKKSSL